MLNNQVNTVFFSILLVVFIFYLPGLLLYPFFSDYYVSYYSLNINPYFSFFLIFLLFAVSTYTIAFFVFRLPTIKRFRLNQKVMILLITFVCVLFFLSGVEFSLFQSRAFRHEGRLAEASILTKLLFILQPIVFVYVAKAAIYVSSGGRLGQINKFLLMMVTFTMVISLSSSSHMISICLLLCILFFPGLIQKKISDIRFFDYAKYAFGAGIVVAFALFGGLGSKLGYSFIFSFEGFDYIEGHIGYIVARVSSSLYSLGAVWDQGVINAERDVEVITSFYTTTINRIALILGAGGFDAEVIATVNKINYNLIFGEDGSRAGASPGPLSSMLYFPYFPLGLLVLPFIYVLIGSLFLKSARNPDRVTVLGLGVAFYFIIYMFEAPLNILYLVDPVFFGFVTIFFLNWFTPERMYGK